MLTTAPRRGGPQAEVRERLLDAALATVARRGLARTTVGEVARAAGCSRATAYRCFPGGRDELLGAAGARELRRLVATLVEPLRHTHDAEDALTLVLAGAAGLVRDHQALQRLLDAEPEALLPFIGFRRVDQLHRAASELVGPHLVPFVGEERAGWAAEWLARIVISYLCFPADGPGPHDEDRARHLVRTYLRPALCPTGASASASPTAPEGS